MSFTNMNGVVHNYQSKNRMMIGTVNVNLSIDSGYEPVSYSADCTNHNQIAVCCRKVIADA